MKEKPRFSTEHIIYISLILVTLTIIALSQIQIQELGQTGTPNNTEDLLEHNQKLYNNTSTSVNTSKHYDYEQKMCRSPDSSPEVNSSNLSCDQS